jgi:hypothetical protein
LSGRPATNQYEIKTEQSDNPKLESLFEPKSIEMLKNLRHQIEIAQDNQGNKS